MHTPDLCKMTSSIPSSTRRASGIDWFRPSSYAHAPPKLHILHKNLLRLMLSSWALCSGAINSVAAQPADEPEAFNAPPTQPVDTYGWSWSGQLGAAGFMNARSLAIEHMVKPAASLHVGIELMPRVEIGGGVSGVLTTDDNYGVWAGYGHGRYRIVSWPGFEWGALAGIGLAHNAPIVHADLRSEVPVVPYGRLATDVLWPLSPSTWLGIELGFSQLSVVTLGAALRFR